jgi:monoterpene epsilon-lactone hydrolase
MNLVGAVVGRLVRKARFWSLVVVLLSSVVIRRLIFGPRRPSWTFTLELLVALLRISSKLSPPKQAKIERIRQITGQPPKLRSRVHHQPVLLEGRIKGEWMTHENVEKENSGTVVLYLHGGAYCILSSKTHRGLTSKISKITKAPVLAIDYRLAPEWPFPCALEDAVATYKWLINPGGGGVAPCNLVIAGDSAGGGLTIATLIYLRDEKLPLPAAAVCLSPWVDLECSTDSWKRNQKFDYLPVLNHEFDCARMYACDQSLRHPLISPIHARLEGLPPLLIQVGEVEVLHDEAVLFAAKAKEAMVDVTLEVYPDMIHVFQAFGALTLPQARDAMASIGTFVEEKVRLARTSEGWLSTLPLVEAKGTKRNNNESSPEKTAETKEGKAQQRKAAL